MKLDDLARQSTDAARVSVAHLDTPELGRSAGRNRAPMLLGAAAVMLVIGLGAFFVLRDDPAETVTAGSGELPVLGLSDPASFGLTLAGMFGPDEMADGVGAEEFSATFVYFGTPGADDPFAAGDLLVGELVVDEPDPLSDGTPVTVRGVDAVIAAPEESGMFADVTVVEWLEPTGDGGQNQMILASSVLNADELVAVADGLDVSGGVAEVALGDAVAVPGALRDLEVVAVDDGFPALFSSFRSGDGPVVGYERAETISSSVVESIAVSSRAGTLTDSIVADRWWASSAESVEVAGEPAWLLTYEFRGTGGEAGDPVNRVHTVAWQWAPGVTASVTATTSGGSGLAVGVAQAVVELDPATVDDAQGGTLENQAAGDFDEVWGTGSGEVVSDVDGSTVAWAWALGLQDGQFCTSLSSGSGGTSSCEPLAQLLDRVPQAPVVVAQQQMDALQFGVIAAGPGQVVVSAEGTPGELIEVLVPNDADGTRLLVWVGTADVPARFDVVVDSEIVTTLDLADGVAATEETQTSASTSASEVDGDALLGLTDLEFTTLDGEPFALSSIIGTQTVVTFFASWCAPCQTGLDDIVAAIQQVDGVGFLGVNSNETDADGARFLVNQAGVAFPVVVDDGSTLFDAFDAPGMPLTAFINADGTVAGIHIGVLDEDLLLATIEADFGSSAIRRAGTPAATGPGARDAAVKQAGLAAMASDGLTIASGLIPDGYLYSHVTGSGAARRHIFVATDGDRGRIEIGRSRGATDPTAGYDLDRMQLVDRSGRDLRLWVFDTGQRTFAVAKESVDGAVVEVGAYGTVRNRAVDFIEGVRYDADTDVDDGALPTVGRVTSMLEGLTLDEAQLLAIAEGWQLRVTRIDGVGQTSTDDLVENRVNLIVTDGLVVGAGSIG